MCLKERVIGSICLPFRNPHGYSMLEEQTMRIGFFVFFVSVGRDRTFALS